ncbi:MAG: recombinase family protein, partial [Clostridiales Family XIII bacterium]|nr:recombinase family protein [Clostridiales Family XIII bacterium]
MTTKKEPKPYIITKEVFSQIRETIGSRIPETGGILGSSDGSHIDYFYFDETANVTGATYARVSTEQDEQQSSYEAQVNYYNQYIRNNPAWEFVGIYADEGITGTNTKKRDGFNR